MWDDDDKRRVGDVLNRTVAYRNGEAGPGIIFDAIKEMLDIERRIQSSIGNHRRVSAMPWLGWLHTAEESAEIFKQRMLDVAAGEPMDKVFGFKVEATPDDISTMESISRVFRSCVTGNHIDRDWRILCDMALFDMNAAAILRSRGVRVSIKSIARQNGVSEQTVKDRKSVQCAAIWSKVKGLVRVSTEAVATTWISA